MIGALVIIVMATCVLIAGMALGVLSYRKNLRFADDCADQYIDEINIIARSGEFPKELIEHLYRLGEHVDDMRFAMRICYNFKQMIKKRVRPSDTASHFTRTFDRLNHGQKDQFMKAMALFLCSICYRDPINGAFMRRTLLSGARDRAMRDEAAVLADMCDDHRGMAHA